MILHLPLCIRTSILLGISFLLFQPIDLNGQNQNVDLYRITDRVAFDWQAKTTADTRMSPVKFNESVLSGIRDGIITGFQIDGFDGQQDQIKVRRVIEHPDGDWSFTGMINGDWKNSFTLSVSDDRILSSIKNIEEHSFHEIRFEKDLSNHILVEFDPHQRERISCGIHDERVDGEPESDETIAPPEFADGSSTIDVMVVYTPAAENWADTHSSGIKSVINQAMALAQNSVDNSQVDIEFRLVHTERVNYTESGNSITDLDRLTDGDISQVRSLRNEYAADLVSMFTQTNDFGGYGWILNSTGGRADLGYSITRVQQAGWTTTHAHEMGHNMGNHHSRNQSSSPAGSSGGLFNYSTGWRWTGNDGVGYVSVMTYSEGDHDVDLFSNPDVSYEGVPTGSYSGTYAPADNARSLNQIRNVIASYRSVEPEIEPPTVSTSSVHSISTSSAESGGNVTDDGGSSVTDRGICWSKNEDPDLSDDCISRGDGTGSFTATMSGLDMDTRYYVRAYARNSAGTSYGNQRDFRTLQITVDPDLSTITAAPVEVQADGVESSTITVTARDKDGNRLSGFDVSLFTQQGMLHVDDNSVETDSQGEAVFSVTNNIPGIVVYGATAGGETLSSTVNVAFIPVAPVALAATNVQERQFSANWEMVQGAESYRLDVSANENFSEILPNYQNKFVGNLTTYIVKDVSAGSEYWYRVRAEREGLTGAYSESIRVFTFPDAPTASQAGNIGATYFTANWQQAEGAQNYRLDVSSDGAFEQMVSGFSNLDVGNALSSEVTGLTPGTEYYYRVRSEAGPRKSVNSSVVLTSTLSINPENSEISSSQLRVLADGDQANEISVIVKSDEAQLLDKLNVELQPDGGSSSIKVLQGVTDETGTARFSVTNTVPETVTYSVAAEGVEIGDVKIEFLENDGELSLGHNYPNPFQHVTTIPVTVPSQMEVKLTIYNALGVPVRTILDETRERGYYEIPFRTAGLASGVYFYRLSTQDKLKTRKMVFVD